MKEPDADLPPALRIGLKLLAIVAILGAYLLLFSALLAGTKATTGLVAFGLLFSGIILGACTLALAVLTASSIERAVRRKEVLRRFLRGLGIACAIVLAATVLEYTFLMVATDGSLVAAVRRGGTGRLVLAGLSFITTIALLQLSLPRDRRSQRRERGTEE